MSPNKRVTPAPESGQCWGIFGGAFDPIHNGHLNLVRQIQEIKKFDGVLVVPSANPQHRDRLALSSFADRLAMVTLALKDMPFCCLSKIEAESDLSGYTLDTLKALAHIYPKVEWTVIVGADQALQLDTWREPEQILALAHLAVGVRPGYEPRIPKITGSERVEVIQISPVDLSSSTIRARVSKGISESDLTELVPPQVAAYIVTHGLYLT